MGAPVPGGPAQVDPGVATARGASPALQVATAPVGEHALRVTVAGEVDLATADEVRQSVHAALAERPGRVEVDLASTTFVDAVGVRALVDSARAADDAGVHLSVCNPHGIVARVLAVTGAAGTLDLASPPETRAPSVATETHTLR